MFTYNLYTKKDKAYYTIPLLMRIFCAFFVALIAFGFISAYSEMGWSNSFIIPLVFLFLLLFYSLYRDSWEFNNTKQTITAYNGFGPFCKKRVFSYQDIKRLELSHFAKGINADVNYVEDVKVNYIVIFALDDGVDKYKIEVMKEKTSAGKIERIANLVSSFTGLELYIDRPRHLDINLKRVF